MIHSSAEHFRKNDCNCFHALDGYETYRVDSCTVGVRPIWRDPIKDPPPAMQTVLLVYEGKVIIGWNESVQPEEDPCYIGYEPCPYSFLGTEGITHWMPLPKPPREIS